MHLLPLLLCAVYVAYACCSPLFELTDGVDLSPVTTRQSLSSSKDTSSTPPSTSNTPLVRVLATSVTGIVALWTAVTYFLVIKYGPSLSQGFVLPLSSLERSLSTLLYNSWIPTFGSALQPDDRTRFKVLRFAGIHTNDLIRSDSHLDLVDSGRACRGLGYQELSHSPLIPAQQDLYRKTGQFRQFWLNAASPVMKNIIQIAIWEFWSFWMSIARVALTLIYNGFIYQQPGPDGVLRLVLISAYAVANIAHLLWSCRLLSQIVNAVGNQACWVVISKLCFFFSTNNYCDWLATFRRQSEDIQEMEREDLHLRRFSCDLLGPTKVLEAYWSSEVFAFIESRLGILRSFYIGDRMPEIDDHRIFPVLQPTRLKFESTAEDDIKPMLDIEVKSFEKSGEAGLDRILANIIVILGVCLSTGLASWTTVQSQDSTATQIGSYAIILAISTGVTSLIGSLSHLSNAAESAKTLQGFQYHMLSLSESQHRARLSAKAARFTSVTSSAQSVDRTVTWLDLLRSTSPWLLLFLPVWGPALGLLPRSQEVINRKQETLQGAQGVQGDATIDENDFIHASVVRFEIAGSVFQFDTTTDELNRIDLGEAKNHSARRRAENKSRTHSKAPEQMPVIEHGGNGGDSIPLQTVPSQIGSSSSRAWDMPR
jgi:hypothetical protein